jgi:hypothetical protein
MVCYTYNGNPQDLDGLALTADISRAGRKIELDIPAELIDGENCFELTDAKYVSVSPDAEGGRLIISEEPVGVIITASSELKQLSNNQQTLDLGKYVQFPFLEWIYPEGVIAGCTDNYHTREDPATKEEIPFPAWDFIPKPSVEYPTLVGTPVLAPVDGIAYVFTMVREEELVKYTKNISIMIYSPDTGYLIDLTHEYELVDLAGKWTMLEEFSGKEVSASEKVGIIGPTDYMSGVPHNHMHIIVPPQPVILINDPQELARRFYTNISTIGAIVVPSIDFLKENLFINQNLNDQLNSLGNSLTNCMGYPQGRITVQPQQLPFVIDGKADDWQEYKPVLTDRTGDSEAGSVMDFSELYMTKDDNYLYLMLKAGDKPSSEWESWAVDLYTDNFKENSCGESERQFQVYSLYPEGVLFSGETGCIDSSSELSPAVWTWEEVLEVRIPLAYLRNPSDLQFEEVKAYLVDSKGYTIPDIMK